MKNIYVIALAAILFQGCGQKKEMTAPATRPVKTTIVESRSVIRKDFSGIVEAVEYVKLAFRVSGQIISLPVIEGEKVKKGQLIAAIDPRDIALQYAATKSAYETASAQVERNKRLLSRQAISVQEYEISLSNYQKAYLAFQISVALGINNVWKVFSRFWNMKPSVMRTRYNDALSMPSILDFGEKIKEYLR